VKTKATEKTTVVRYPVHGYVGIAIIIFAEALLFSGNRLVGRWFTPIVWTGYILLATHCFTN
jgi:hypothetical protein